ncbi:MAG: AAA family ATPase [Gammaproteobacteria bacterium]|nr:AAA family ATPase [Gammaproteobacteria bacterium]MBQ0838361.1 AAA family ATPase [Gammaproteobacteria bacterium]
MRILQLRFKNLNSLLGEWQVDLTDPSFGNEGIFAITGPTGAGKSTLLDAICLALYGRTPRLSKITKSSNEIMSRHSGECFAEITFETAAGQFRCHWSQHRARKKADGDLQAPKHEIADAQSGQIIESKIRHVAASIENITGMDFERFTLSMLLAQGSFAAFLQAAPDQRAPILEQITGSAIYSQISTRVHELRAAETHTLNTLQAELAGMALLSSEDEALLTTQLQQQAGRESELNHQREQYSQAIQWLDTIANLQGELQVLDQQQQTLLTRRNAFKTSAEKLQNARRAQQLAADYASLCALRQAQNSEQTTEQQCRLELPAKNLALTHAENNLAQSKQRLLQSRDSQRSALPIIRQTQALDLKAQQQQHPIDKAAATLKELQQSISQRREQREKNRQRLAENEAELATLITQITAHQADATLVDQLSGLQSRFAALRILTTRCDEKTAGHDAAKAESHRTQRNWQQQSREVAEQAEELQQLELNLRSQQSARLQTLAGQDISHWRQSHTNLTERKQQLENFSLHLNTLTQSQDLEIKLNSRQAQINNDIASNRQHVLIETEKQAGLERELDLLETQLVLINKIQSFEQARQQLEDGEPCPLCGGDDHPYAAGNVPRPDGSSDRIYAVKTALNTVSQQLVTYQVRAAQDGKELEQLEQQIRQSAQHINEQQARLQQTRQDLNTSGLALPESDQLADLLPQIEKHNRNLLDKTHQRLATIDQQEQTLATLRSAVESAKKASHHLAQAQLSAGHEKDTAEKTFARVKDERAELLSQLQQAQGETLVALSIYGINTLPEDGFTSIETALITRREQWLAKQLAKSNIDQSIGNITLQIQHQSQVLSDKGGELEKQRVDHDSLLSQQNVLKRERVALFDNKDPVLEESLLAAAVVATEKRLEADNHCLRSVSEEVTTLSSQLKAIANSLRNRAGPLKNAEEHFQQRRIASLFATEGDYLAASISDEMREKLSSEAEQLDAEQSGLEARHKDRSERLKKEREKYITARTIEALNQDLDNATSQLKLAQQEFGACRQKLDDNRKLRASQQARATAIDTQKTECQRWDNLHLLIGSADGKKYRNFAQGLTFELLVGHANRQLQKMSDRYLLIRDKQQPLELNVVDNYQAGEIRSTKNLSGGESFIVSLALALGLSQMASKNVRVDSLFLDEGFGTLDEDALDTALEALSSLQQSGKLIGVISHVASLKERIGTQIQVNPQSGGRSVLSGPGCKRLN